MNAWLIRPFPEQILRIKEFKSNNIVAIGWPKIGDLKGNSREDIKRILSDHGYSGLELGNAYATINIFVNRISKGDLVLVPDGDDIYFGEVTSDYSFVDSDISEGYPHQRSVKWRTNVSRTSLSKALRLSLKVHRATADLSIHVAEIESLAKGLTVAKPLMLDFSYPLRSDITLNFQLPEDMTKGEAERLTLFFRSLYFRE